MIQYYPKDANIISAFLKTWLEDTKYLALLASDECESIYFDCDDIHNCFMELKREGFTQSMKRIFQGDHFYRSDTGKCLRCWRHRPELHWNNENLKNADCCDRCAVILIKQNL